MGTETEEMPAYVSPDAGELAIYVAVAATYYLVGYCTVGALWPDTFASTKRRAWILTWFCCILLGPLSLPYVRDYVWNWDEAGTWSDDPLSRVIAVLFVVFLVIDLVLAVLHYPDQMHMVAGWVHHLSYIVLFSGLL